MSTRLQVLIPPELDARLRKAAQRNRMSKGEWVRRTLEDALRQPEIGGARSDALTRLASLEAPTSNIDKMLSEIETGRS